MTARAWETEPVASLAQKPMAERHDLLKNEGLIRSWKGVKRERAWNAYQA